VTLSGPRIGRPLYFSGTVKPLGSHQISGVYPKEVNGVDLKFMNTVWLEDISHLRELKLFLIDFSKIYGNPFWKYW